MFSHSRFRQARCVVGVLALLAVAATSGLLDAGPKRLSPKKHPNPFEAAALERARAGAARSLHDPECLKLLTDFTDGAGRTLDQTLETWGLSAADYLQQAVLFEDGSSLPACQRTPALLVTVPGLPRVFLCTPDPRVLHSRFAEIQVRSPEVAQAMVIHEMLHTLGLGENPPTTFEITEQVQRRCH